MKAEELVLIEKGNLEVVLDDNKIVLPDSIQKDIDEHWEGLLRDGNNFKRGEVFTIKSVEKKDRGTVVELSVSDYAHYLYTQRVGLENKYACKNLHTSCLIETCDEKLVFGRMGRHTAMSGVIQCAGGGLDNDDIKGKNVDLENNIKRELMEEVGIEAKNKEIVDELRIKYLKYSLDTNKVAAIFVLKLKIDSQEFMRLYDSFESDCKKKGELPEFEEIVCLPKNRSEVEEFVQKERDHLNHYMEVLLKSEASE
ncbi:MAG: hypothetical protein OEV93_01030 [Candidatus Moranbacteria bacterium]|nr:hypothetical protein [Candidatus Moranbacteria bacterium]